MLLFACTVQMLPPANCWPVLPFARRTLLVNPALIDALHHGRMSSGQAADHLTRAALVIDGGLTRSDAFLTYWTTPWQILAGIGDGVARALRAFPLVSFAWRARCITIGIAVIQTIHDGPYWLAALIATIGILSYAAPAWIRRWDATLTTYGNHTLAIVATPHTGDRDAPERRQVPDNSAARRWHPNRAPDV